MTDDAPHPMDEFAQLQMKIGRSQGPASITEAQARTAFELWKQEVLKLPPETPLDVKQTRALWTSHNGPNQIGTLNPMEQAGAILEAAAVPERIPTAKEVEDIDLQLRRDVMSRVKAEDITAGLNYLRDEMLREIESKEDREFKLKCTLGYLRLTLPKARKRANTYSPEPQSAVSDRISRIEGSE